MTRTWLSDCRLLLNILSSDKLRPRLAEALSGGRVADVIARLSFMSPDGLNKEQVLALRSALNDSLSPLAQLEAPPVELPPRAGDRLPLSQRACAAVFERAGWTSCTEAELNAALAQLVDDVALARRDCVDSGFLLRDLAGSRYHLAPEVAG